ncbi:MAG: type II secretion system protein [Candidatus Omnitrophica bacterium]|nr:type II secretion system protein [Candidatus Omnitrophota bacterium]
MKSLKLKIKKGFTLIETIVATMLMSLVLGSLAFSLSYFLNAAGFSTSQDIAANAAQTKLEEISRSNISQIITNYNGHNFPVLDNQGNVLLTPPNNLANPGSVTVTQVNGTTDLFNVTVIITWIQNRREISKSINSTFVSK